MKTIETRHGWLKPFAVPKRTSDDYTPATKVEFTDHDVTFPIYGFQDRAKALQDWINERGYAVSPFYFMDNRADDPDDRMVLRFEDKAQAALCKLFWSE